MKDGKDAAECANLENVEPAIDSIRVLSSGTAEQHKEHRYGSRLPRLLWVLTSRSWVELPLNYFLIWHRTGPILFDTGIDPAIASKPDYIVSPIGRFLLRRIFRIHVTEADRLDRKLQGVGVDPRQIRVVVISHMHFDHVGGIAHVPQAELLVSAQEWDQLSEPHPEHEWMLREHIQIPGANWRPFAFAPSDAPLFEGFDGIHDLMGDGSMILLPTPGHTPGSLSMLIRRPGWAPILLVADLTYDAALLEQGRVPGTGDATALRRSYASVRRLKEQLPDVVIVPSHDFGAADAIAGATRAARSP